MPESFFDSLPSDGTEKTEVEVKAEVPQEEAPKPEPTEEKRDPRDIALERKSTALSEERRKRKELEARLKELEAKKEGEEPEDEEEPKLPAPQLDEESLLKKLDERRRQEEYRSKVADRIMAIAQGAGKPRQWAERILATVENLPQGVRSGGAEADVATAIRYLDASEGASSLGSTASKVDLPSSTNQDQEGLSSAGRELARQKMGLKDEEIDKYLATPRSRMDNGNVSFKLIK